MLIKRERRFFMMVMINAVFPEADCLSDRGMMVADAASGQQEYPKPP